MKSSLGSRIWQKYNFQWRRFRNGWAKKIPITSGVKYIFLLTFSVAKRISPLSKKIYICIFFKEIMLTANPRQEPCWIQLSGKMISQDATGNNSVGNPSTSRCLVLFCLRMEKQESGCHELGWLWAGWGQLPGADPASATHTGIWSHMTASGITLPVTCCQGSALSLGLYLKSSSTPRSEHRGHCKQQLFWKLRKSLQPTQSNVHHLP